MKSVEKIYIYIEREFGVNYFWESYVLKDDFGINWRKKIKTKKKMGNGYRR